MSSDDHGKLIKVRQLIAALLTEHDVCGDIILVSRSNAEIYTHLEASWCRIKLQHVPEGGVLLRITSQKKDYANPDEQRKELEFTAGVARMFAEATADHAMSWITLSEFIDDKLGAEHTTPVQLPDDKGTKH